jgi:hypothetical protein
MSIIKPRQTSNGFSIAGFPVLRNFLKGDPPQFADERSSLPDCGETPTLLAQMPRDLYRHPRALTKIAIPQ